MPRPRRDITMSRCARAAMLAAIEIYNKPTVEYREQTFAILITNAWEILLKARIVQQANGTMSSIYMKKKGRYVRDPETGEPKTITLRQALGQASVPEEVSANVMGLIAVRNASIHMGVLRPEIAQRILGYGTASVQNFIRLSAQWFEETIEAPYLLPLGFVGRAKLSKGVYPKSQRDLLRILDDLTSRSMNDASTLYSVDIKVNVNLDRNLSGGGSIGLTNNTSAPRVQLTDDEVLRCYRHSYRDVVAEAKERYSNFKQNLRFNEMMTTIKGDPRCTFERRLDPKNSKSTKKYFYNLSATLAILDEEYSLRG